MSWTSTPLIDPHLDLTREQRRVVSRAAWGRWLKQPGRQRSLAILLLFVMVILAGLMEILVDGRRWYLVLLALAIYAATLVGMAMIMRRLGYAPCVYAELRDRGYDVCPRCGYHLVDLPAGHACPECGRGRPAK